MVSLKLDENVLGNRQAHSSRTKLSGFVTYFNRH
jgi:hypothetical protein